MYQQLGPLAAQVQQRFGVPAPILLAIWGHET
ncbi:MAG: lytic murein transglycosylase, partial [Croceibacterium sp.]